MLILVANEKGGTGKTTVAVNLACMAACSGRDTLLVDTDPQKSSKIWESVRQHTPVITCVEMSGRVGQGIYDLGERYEVVVVDSGGRDSIEMRQAMAVCDLTIIPVRPSQWDVWSMNRMAQLISRVAEDALDPVRAVALINAASPNPMIREAEEARAALDDFLDVFPTFQTTLHERIVYRRAAREGKGVAEMPLADPKALAELASLYQEIFHEAYTAKASSE